MPLTVESRLREYSGSVKSYRASLNLVDLAGSERASQTKVVGIRLMEVCMHGNRVIIVENTTLACKYIYLGLFDSEVEAVRSSRVFFKFVEGGQLTKLEGFRQSLFQSPVQPDGKQCGIHAMRCFMRSIMSDPSPLPLKRSPIVYGLYTVRTYLTLFVHPPLVANIGEKTSVDDGFEIGDTEEETIGDVGIGMGNFVDSAFRLHGDAVTGDGSLGIEFDEPYVPEPDLGKRYYDYKKKATEKLYPTCEGPETTLSALVELHNVKKEFGWCRTGMTRYSYPC
ncbi:hypothetical protein IFM89_012074 [Coptis chinensis]|uniref:Kinesin-like protein n=1 Tax=Coptis chinensis TaxID=261450 RepID=A0A835M323_9MAGN|nr:hypothetical protein IFM89_012074 [Coptis chinensis]